MEIIMSVLKSKRRPTPFQVEINFKKLRKTVTLLTFRNFGYKPPKDIPDEAKEMYLEFIKDERAEILKLFRDASRYITMANSIRPAYSFEYNQRRELMNIALGLCYDILSEFQYTIETLELDINKFGESVSLMKTEIALIKGWRQSDNPKRKKLLLKERQEQQAQPDSGAASDVA